MVSIFFTSVALFIVMYGKCREIMIEANKAAITAKNKYDANTTTYH